jgi:hypothetical protein
MTLEEFSKRCLAMADEFHALQDDATDEEGDPQGVMKAILAAHLRYVIEPDLLKRINNGL